MLHFGQVKNAAQQLAISRDTVMRYCREHPSIKNNGKIDVDKLEEAIKNTHRRTARGFPLGKRWLRKNRYSIDGPWLQKQRKPKKTARAIALQAAIRQLHERRLLLRARRGAVLYDAKARRGDKAGGGRDFVTIESVWNTWRAWRGQVEDIYREWTPEEIAQFRAFISPIVEFDRGLERLQKTNQQKQRPS